MVGKAFLDTITGSTWTIAEEVTKDPYNGLNTLLYRLTCSDASIPFRYLNRKGLKELLKVGILKEV